MKAPGWTGANIPFKTVLKFVNRLAAAIKAQDSKALVTTGSWSAYAKLTQEFLMMIPFTKRLLTITRCSEVFKAFGKTLEPLFELISG